MTDVTPIAKPTPKVSARGRKKKGSRAERQVARALNGQRMALSGAVGGGDVVAEGWCIEVKARARFAFLESCFAQAESDLAVGDIRRPLVVLKPDRAEAVYCLKESDFLALLRDRGPDNAFKVRETLRSIARLAKQAEGLAT